MARYFIESVKCGVGDNGPEGGMVVAEVEIKSDADEKFYMSLVEVEGIPNFYKTPESTYNLNMADEVDEAENDKLLDYFIEIADYDEVFENPESEWFQLYRYLIYIVRSDWDECEEFQKSTTGKYLDEIEVPVSDLEEDFYEDEDDYEDYDVEIPKNKEELYKLRLTLETDVTTESVFHDMDCNAFDFEKKNLEAMVNACEDEMDYENWKQNYINSEYAKLIGKKFLVCKYVFAGIGQYEMIIPEEGLESYQCWIRGNGSAFDGGNREADEEEIKKFIALNAAK